MPFKRYPLITIALCLFAQAIFARQSSLEISGRILDATNKAPLSNANIAVNHSGTGTITNGAGDFRLLIRAVTPKDTLRVSCLGYGVKYLCLAGLEKNASLDIELQPVNLELKEVVVAAKDPVKLIRAAIKKIPDNYIIKPHQIRGFYRNSSTRDQDYMQLSEAVFDIYNRGYADKSNNDLYLIRTRSIRDEQASHGLNFGLNPSSLFDHDVVKEISNNEILSNEGLRNHRFMIRGVVDYKGMPAYEIIFDQRDGLRKSLYRGKLYIDTGHLVFLAIDYSLSPKGIAYNSYGNLPTKTLMAVLDIHISTRKDGAKVEYQKVGNRWVLSNAVSNTTLNFRSKRKQFDFTTNSRVDYIITAVDTTKTEPESEGKHLGKNKLIESQSTPLEAEFWRRNTMILPDFDAEAVAGILKSRNENYNLKKRFEERLPQLPADPAVRIDSMLTFYHHKGQFNGTALIKSGSRIMICKSYGYANKEQQLRADSNTQYRIGSLSKSFTALAIMQLAQEGKLSLKDSVKRFLPDYVNGDVTIEQLLTHQSGIPNYTNNNEYLSRIMHQPFSLKELVSKFCSDSTEFAPGTQFQYSNSGYVLLALIAETVSGKPFPRLLKERIFVPAGMKDTYAGADTTVVSRRATGYLYDRIEPSYNTINTLGAGGVIATAADLLRWSEALYANVLLPKEQMEELFRPRAAYTDWDAFYGYGWMIDRRLFRVSKASHVVSYHPGTDFGFYTMFVRQPDSGTVVVLLNNTGDFPRFDLTDLILKELDQY